MQAPKNELKPWDLIEIAFRRRWAIILPLFIAVMAGLISSFVMPKIYKASTLILVQPQQLPQDVVRSAVPDEEDSRLSNIAQRILSRTNLARVIADFGLYTEPEYENVSIESKIDTMRGNITIELSTDELYTDAFTIAFMGTEPQKVMKVTNALATYFIDATFKERETSAIGTSDFLADELENTRKRLGDMEVLLKEYRQRFMGELPEQLNSNLATLERLQGQLNKKEDALREIRLRLSMLDKQIEEERYRTNISGLGGREGSSILETETTDVGLLKEQLANLLTRYTDQHPDVKNLKSKIAQLEAEIAAARGGASSINRSGIATSRSRYLSQIERQRTGLLNEKGSVETEIIVLNREIASYQERVENTPKREQEFITLQRDYDNLSGLYKSLLNRKLEAEMSVSMERKQKGEQFQVLDSARLPSTPFKPNLKIMIILSVAFGLALGSGLVFLLEYMRNTYNNPDEIEAELKIPVIAMIPPVLTKRDIFMKRAEVTICSLILVLTAAAVGVFAFVTLTGTDKAIEIVQQYLST